MRGGDGPGDGLHQRGLAGPDTAIEEERVERHRAVGADRGFGDAPRRRMRQLVGLADDEILEGEARVERRADVLVVAGVGGTIARSAVASAALARLFPADDRRPRAFAYRHSTAADEDVDGGDF